MIEVLSTAALTTVQDLGRYGQRRYGVGTAGAMDRLALTLGNEMLGNDPNAAGLEITLTPFKIRFLRETSFAVAGADFDASLDGTQLLPWWATTAKEGQELMLKRPVHGARAYLCIAGGIDVPPVLGSRSTQMRGAIGGYEGRQLRRGDVLTVNDCPLRRGNFGIIPPEHRLAPGSASGSVTVRAIPAGEYEKFTEASCKQLWTTPWQITPQSNRTGYRLQGQKLELTQPLEMRSHGIIPGVVQVPPSGQPVVQLADANVSGGYPKIATVISADLWRLAQARIGEHISFVQVDVEEALSASRAIDEYIKEVRRATALAMPWR
ncbi:MULTISPECIES: biotin-dependent carboxyltransferase family protein [unclassified Cupriavidus]|uniref:5-oxoprolinase subunit C family protein n=1 Tax=unclassified Cupriavidus TaxID=2640874 RepID=UPI0010542A8A|nr:MULTISPECIES: biotin-dependent carboxyltransferase family protein [unclassified Cupriavidus]MBF6989134.1 biotin-dependent carboxyltransferase family protein [Cupriavidus sp. IK-TO18]TDF61925.1 biotin-dependent carboxyltransferase family protein [Cupriavidus sp. L7L]